MVYEPYKQLASRLMYSGTSTTPTGIVPMLESLELEYRSRKNFSDVCDALRKALKNGHAKTEHELSMFEVYLKDVFKIKRSKA